jgi:hypothetical protein
MKKYSDKVQAAQTIYLRSVKGCTKMYKLNNTYYYFRGKFCGISRLRILFSPTEANLPTLQFRLTLFLEACLLHECSEYERNIAGL